MDKDEKKNKEKKVRGLPYSFGESANVLGLALCFCVLIHVGKNKVGYRKN